MQFSVQKFACVRHGFCFCQCFRMNLILVLKELFPEIESVTEHRSLSRSHKSQEYVRPSANLTWKGITVHWISDLGEYLSLTGYSYLHHVIILVVCPLKSLEDSRILYLRNRGISATSLNKKASMSTICSKKRMSFYLEVPRPSYKTRSGETCFVVMFNKTRHSRSMPMKTFSQTRTLVPAKLVKRYHFSPPEWKH